MTFPTRPGRLSSLASIIARLCLGSVLVLRWCSVHGGARRRGPAQRGRGRSGVDDSTTRRHTFLRPSSVIEEQEARAISADSGLLVVLPAVNVAMLLCIGPQYRTWNHYHEGQLTVGSLAATMHESSTVDKTVIRPPFLRDRHRALDMDLVLQRRLHYRRHGGCVQTEPSGKPRQDGQASLLGRANAFGSMRNRVAPGLAHLAQ